MVLSAGLEARLYGRQGCPPLHQPMLPRPIRLGIRVKPWKTFPCIERRCGYDGAMPDAYGQLLDATIQHLEDLKSRGVRHVTVAPETLRALARPPAAGSQIPNFKSQIEMPASTGAPISKSARTEFSRVAGPETGTPQPVAEQKSLLALPGETATWRTPRDFKSSRC